MGSGVVRRIVRAIVPRIDRPFGAVILFMAGAMLPGIAARAAGIDNGQRLDVERCTMCHGADMRGTGPLARKSNPPTPNLTTPAFRKRLAAYPGVIVSSIILQANGDLIPRTLRENGHRVPPHAWTIKDSRDLDAYMKRMVGADKARPRSQGD